MSVLSIVIHRDEGQESRRGHLLALHVMRRNLEWKPYREQFAGGTSMAVTTTDAIGELLELIAALDRRVPRVERAGEAGIAREAAELKNRAMKRIEELEREGTLHRP